MWSLTFRFLCNTYLGPLKFESQVFTVSKLVLLQTRFINLYPLRNFPSMRLRKSNMLELWVAFFEFHVSLSLSHCCDHGTLMFFQPSGKYLLALSQRSHPLDTLTSALIKWKLGKLKLLINRPVWEAAGSFQSGVSDLHLLWLNRTSFQSHNPSKLDFPFSGL